MTDRSLDSGPMALSVTGAAKHYASGFTLNDVTFDLPAGYVMGLIGPNGAGKSTLIKLILNMIRRDAGTIESFGRDSVRDEEAFKADLGVVFDSSFLLLNMAIIIFDMAISGVIMALFGAGITVSEVVFAALYSMLIFALLSALLVPVLYRFGFGKGIRVLMVGAFAVFLVLGVLMGLAVSSADLRRWLNGLLEIVAGAVRAIADSPFPGLGALIAVAVCAASIAISHRVSRRIWNGHEM
ncbi:hypothetical protein EP30_03150 [Bifidobacterium sp. UTCIF-39]|nr:hypothetical protein EP30_03150 [Bifidobacterium sp. UTCIF-39]